MRSSSPNSPKVFLDSSIVISAVLSDKGGSFRLFNEAQNKHLIIYISDFVLEEVVSVLKLKYPLKLNSLENLLSSTPFVLAKDPSQDLIEEMAMLISDFFDAPILAATKKAKVDFLITLDKKHFLTKKVKENVKFKVLTPKEFLQDYFKQLF
jgi:putative PIN family toxin of toxin-antitoxin system